MSDSTDQHFSPDVPGSDVVGGPELGARWLPEGSERGGKGVGVFRVRDGPLSAQRIHFDRLILVEQLGVPSPASGRLTALWSAQPKTLGNPA